MFPSTIRGLPDGACDWVDHAFDQGNLAVKWHGSLLLLALSASSGLAQETPITAPNGEITATIPEPVLDESSSIRNIVERASSRGYLEGNRNFSNFIGYVSNPLFAIDPRSQTNMYPIFDSVWVRPSGILPSGNIQLYGAGLTLALTDRLSVGLNQGGYVVSHFDRGERRERLPNRDLRRARNRDGSRDGWLNLGGFVQYTLIQNVPRQFLLTAGLHWEAPSGEAEVFQGQGPVKLAPYITLGKELGEFHLLTTTGYLFPTGSATLTNLFYGTVHLDRRLFGWIYPLIECNWAYHTSSVDFNVPEIPNYFSFGNFEGSGNIVSLSTGINTVLVKDRLELGGVYTTTVATQRDFSFNGLLIRMVFRY